MLRATRESVPLNAFALRLGKYSLWIDKTNTFLHAVFLLLVPLAVFAYADTALRRFLIVGFAFSWLLILPSATVYWANDRMVTLALPAWASVYTVSAWVVCIRCRMGLGPGERRDARREKVELVSIRNAGEGEKSDHRDF